jgi:hypothetical protein
MKCKIKPIKITKKGEHIYKIGCMKGNYKLKSIDKKSGRFIFKKVK